MDKAKEKALLKDETRYYDEVFQRLKNQCLIAVDGDLELEEENGN